MTGSLANETLRFAAACTFAALLAAGMAAQSAQFFYNAGAIDVLGATMWDTSWLLTEGSLFGQLLHTLVGYTAQPTQLQLIVYVAALLLMAVLMRVARPAAPQARPSAHPAR